MGAHTARLSRDQRRETIIEVAREVFLEEGYAAASMSTIAARLGGSKGTLYNYFRSKEELFEANIRSGCARIAADMFDPFMHERPVAETLTEFGRRYLAHIFSDWAIRTFRLIVTEAARSPELARIFYEAGPAVGLRKLQEYFEAARARGLIKAPDCARAADQFMCLCRGHLHFSYVLNLERTPSSAQIEAQVEAAVIAFMSLYGA